MNAALPSRNLELKIQWHSLSLPRNDAIVTHNGSHHVHSHTHTHTHTQTHTLTLTLTHTHTHTRRHTHTFWRTHARRVSELAKTLGGKLCHRVVWEENDKWREGRWHLPSPTPALLPLFSLHSSYTKIGKEVSRRRGHWTAWCLCCLFSLETLEK